jgi:hypothetical protein
MRKPRQSRGNILSYKSYLFIIMTTVLYANHVTQALFYQITKVSHLH